MTYLLDTCIRISLKKYPQLFRGLPIGPYDVLIAGTSLAYNLVMVTSNMKEFSYVAEITIENWRD